VVQPALSLAFVRPRKVTVAAGLLFTASLALMGSLTTTRQAGVMGGLVIEQCVAQNLSPF